MTWHQGYIVKRARALGLDPAAVLAVAEQEGSSGWGGRSVTAGIGDSGTSFGPWQLHWGGAYPAFAPHGNALAAQKWAMSPAGIDYALKQIQGVARGLTGREAINAIVTRFERPAAPGAEVERAWAGYGKFGNVQPGDAPASSGSTPATPGRVPVTTTKMVGFGPQTIRQFNPALLSQQILRDLGEGDTPDVAQLVQQSYENVTIPGYKVAVKSRKLQRAGDVGPEPHSDASPAPDGTVVAVTPKNVSKWAIAGSGMDRAGLKTNPAVFTTVAKIAQIYGKPLTIGTGSNHNEYVKGSNRRSDHWFGEAADIPMAGDELTRLGQDALIMAGMDPREARKQKGGVFNVGGYNILFNTNVGGNHYNHLHVGMGRIIGRPA